MMCWLCALVIFTLMAVASGTETIDVPPGTPGSFSEKDVGSAAQWAQDEHDVKVFVKFSMNNEHIAKREVTLIEAKISEDEIRMQALEFAGEDGKSILVPERYWFVTKLHAKIDPVASSYKLGPFGVLFMLKKATPKGLGYDPMWPKLVAEVGTAVGHYTGSVLILRGSPEGLNASTSG